MKREPILYISYDGMLEPLGQSQVLSYLERLSTDYAIHLISFEKAEDWRDEGLRSGVTRRIADARIRWKALRYHRRPTAPATAYDIAIGTAAALALVLRHGIRLVHARSYVAGLMALQLKRLAGTRLLFDMRGFWADERVDGNLWPANGRLYRAAKRVERKLLLQADHVVTLTEASAEVIRAFPYLYDWKTELTIIPTCANLQLFRPLAAESPSPFVLGHIGSVGTWYLFDELLQFFRQLRTRIPEARLLVVSRDDHHGIRAALSRNAVPQTHVELQAAGHYEMPAAIARMTAGSAIIKPAYSKIASAPTKLAEYLGCGIPCLGNVGVGDMEAILEGDHVGVALPGFSRDQLGSGVDRLIALSADPELRERCVATARRRFSVDAGASKYAAVYQKMLAQ